MTRLHTTFEDHQMTPRRVIPYKEMEAELCAAVLGGTRRTHSIWVSLTGDGWPAFCANKGCNTVANDPPPWED